MGASQRGNRWDRWNEPVPGNLVDDLFLGLTQGTFMGLTASENYWGTGHGVNCHRDRPLEGQDTDSVVNALAVKDRPDADKNII